MRKVRGPDIDDDDFDPGCLGCLFTVVLFLAACAAIKVLWWVVFTWEPGAAP